MTHLAWRQLNEAQRLYDAAKQAYYKAGRAYEKVLIKYHPKKTPCVPQTGCPNCPWNGIKKIAITLRAV